MHHRLSARVLMVAVAMLLVVPACSAGEATTNEPATTTTVAPTTTGAPVATTTTSAATPTEAPTTTMAAESDAFPVTVSAGNGEVTIPQRPEAIVSLSPTATEMLFAIGAGSQVTAVDSLSDYPAAAPTTELSAFEPNVEAIAEFEPDLVVLSFDPSGDVVPSLETLGIPTIVQFAAATLDDSYDQMTELGAATGNVAGATAAVDAMQRDIEEIASSVPATPEPVTYYHELDDLYYSAASTTFIGEVYGLLGLVSIADDAVDLNFGYPQLSAEFILEADPQMIMLADTKCCAQSAETVAQRPGWSQLAAVASGAIVELDDDIASRWGPRVVDLLEVVSLKLVELDGAG